MTRIKLPQKRIGLMSILNSLFVMLGVFVGLLLAVHHVSVFLYRHLNIVGSPIFGHYYNPVSVLKDLWMYRAVDDLGRVVIEGFFIIICSMGVSVLFVGVWSMILRIKEKPSNVHGSSKWANVRDIKRAGLLKEEGIYLGACKVGQKYQYLRLSQPRNILLYAPSQSGKGTTVVVPNLLSWKESVVVYDPKGECWMKTAGFRSEQLGSVTIKLDLTSNDGSSAHFNPLWEIRPGNNEVRDAQNIARMLVDPDGKGLHDHWTKSAYNFLVGLILHVVYSQNNKSLRVVSDLITDPDKSIEETLNEMIVFNHDPENKYQWKNSLTNEPTYTHPTVASVVREMLNKATEERSGIVSTALSFLGIFRDPVIAGNTQDSDFAIRDLMDHEQTVSLYIIVPESDRDRLRPVVRLLLKLISSRLLEKMEFDKTGRARFNHRLLMVLDEFSRLRYMEHIEEDLAISLGYGIQFLIVTQDISQLYKLYSKDESITGNCHVRIAFAPNKITTANELSAMSGVATVNKYGKNYSGGVFNFSFKSVSEGIHEAQRPLVTPDEVLRLKESEELIFVGCNFPILANRINYFDDPVFNQRSLIVPPSVSDKIVFDKSNFAVVAKTAITTHNNNIIKDYELTVVEDDNSLEDFTL